LVLDSIIKQLEKEIENLIEQAARDVADTVAYLARENSKLKVRPRIKRNGGKSFSIVWIKYLGYDPKTRSPVKQEIRRGRGHLISKSSFLSYLKDCESWEHEYIWEKEQQFAKLRKKVSLLSQALTALNQYVREGDGSEG